MILIDNLAFRIPPLLFRGSDTITTHTSDHQVVGY